ncbi:hypothetical protein CRUP_035391 [Coryphaenoides rupestris]|nr:hypothetical protein CRUP_035391 [Coryphaenoides rupestris]
MRRWRRKRRRRLRGYSLLYSSSYRGTLLSGLQRLRGEGRMCDVANDPRAAPAWPGAPPPDPPPAGARTNPPPPRVPPALRGGPNAPERDAPSVSLPASAPRAWSWSLDFPVLRVAQPVARLAPAVLEAARYCRCDAAVGMLRSLRRGLTAATCCPYATGERHALDSALAEANRTIVAEIEDAAAATTGALLELNGPSMTAALERPRRSRASRKAKLIELAWISNLLLSRLRFGLVPPCDLARLSGSHKALATPLIRSQLTKALEYHRLGSAQPIRQTRQSSLRALPNRVLLVGGGESPDWPGQQILTFDLRDSTFSSLKSRLPQKLRNHSVCSVGGFLFVIGGELVSEGDEGESGKPVAMTTSNAMWRYDPRFDRWEEAESMLDRRSWFSCCVVQDVIYAIGGRQTRPGVDTPTVLSSVEFYNMAAGGWRRGATLPRPIHGHASAVLGNGVYVSGGIPGNPGGNTCHVGNGIHGNSVRAGGGNQGDGGGVVSREVLRWDPSSGGKTWERKASMSIARFGHHMAALHEHIYALLGMHEPFCDIERYDSPADQWTRSDRWRWARPATGWRRRRAGPCCCLAAGSGAGDRNSDRLTAGPGSFTAPANVFFSSGVVGVACRWSGDCTFSRESVR